MELALTIMMYKNHGLEIGYQKIEKGVVSGFSGLTGVESMVEPITHNT